MYMNILGELNRLASGIKLQRFIVEFCASNMSRNEISDAEINYHMCRVWLTARFAPHYDQNLFLKLPYLLRNCDVM